MFPTYRPTLSCCSRLVRQVNKELQTAATITSLVRHVHNEPPTPESIPQLPNYRSRAEDLNNPYRDQFSYGRKPRTFRERYIESKKNEAKPKIGTGDGNAVTDYLGIKRTEHSKNSFYKTDQRGRFSDLGVISELARQVAELGVVHPTTVQSDVIPVLMQNNNCVFIGPTGSGENK